MPGRFVYYEDANGRYRFRLLSEEGDILAVSHRSYHTKQTVRQGCESFKRSAKDATIVED